MVIWVLAGVWLVASGLMVYAAARPGVPVAAILLAVALAAAGWGAIYGASQQLERERFAEECGARGGTVANGGDLAWCVTQDGRPI